MIINDNNYLKQQITLLQQQYSTMHSKLVENSADIVDTKDKLSQVNTQMHNIQINVHHPDDTNTERPTPKPPSSTQQVDLKPINDKINHIQKQLTEDITEIKSDISKMKGEIDSLRHTAIQHDLKIDFNKKHIEKVENKPETNYQPQIDAMRQRQTLLESRFITTHNRVSLLENMDNKIGNLTEKITALDI